MNEAAEPIERATIEEACARLAAGKAVRQRLPGGGSLHIDRLLPFLAVYRRNAARSDLGTGSLVTSEASYLHAPGDAPRRRGLRRLVRRIIETTVAQTSGFLLLEVWSAKDEEVPRQSDEATGETLLPAPRFRILSNLPHRPDGTVARLESALQRIRLQRQPAIVETDLEARACPPGMANWLSAAEAAELNCHVLGLEVLPVYRDPASSLVYEHLMESLRRGVGRALKQAFFRFSLDHTSVRPQHYWVLGRKSLSQQEWTIDRRLAEVSGQFKFLLQVTPVNAERQWRRFAENRHSGEPTFQYRPLHFDPLLLRRKLLQIPTERIDDPALSHLFRQTQDELDRQLLMLQDVGGERFLLGSQQVFGRVDAELLELAQAVLREASQGVESSEATTATAAQLARRARREIAYYRRQSQAFAAQVELRDDMYSGLLSAGGNLLVGRETAVAEHRVDALLQHEVGTHLVTYYNGGSQPLRLLKVGLAGYDALQEGLAVLAEHLAGGLTRARLQTLAARVVATERLIRREKFARVFQELVEEHGLAPRTAYTITMRVYRGGGLTKDAVYLRGLSNVLSYLADGGSLEPLLVGKVSLTHVPVVRQLLLRGVISEPLLRPRYLQDAAALERLEELRRGRKVLDLLKEA